MTFALMQRLRKYAGRKVKLWPY